MRYERRWNIEHKRGVRFSSKGWKRKINSKNFPSTIQVIEVKGKSVKDKRVGSHWTNSWGGIINVISVIVIGFKNKKNQSGGVWWRILHESPVGKKRVRRMGLESRVVNLGLLGTIM